MGMDPGAAGQRGGGNGAQADARKAVPRGIDTSKAHPARVYDYWLGGKDNFAADREAAELALQAYPELAKAVQSNRAFLARAVRYLAGAGIRQFLDIGTGIPAASNTHQVAQREAPDSRSSTWTTTVASRVVHTHAGAVRLPEANMGAEALRASLSAPQSTTLTG